MSKYTKGRSYEYKTMKILEAKGYSCTRAAGSHGIYDIIAWNDKHTIFIQVKYNCNLIKDEKIKFLDNIIPPNSYKEVWVYYPRMKPIILNEGEIRNGFN